MTFGAPSKKVEAYQTVELTQAGAGLDTILAAVPGKTIRLHALVGTLDAAGTIKISYDDDGAATNEVDLSGAMPLAKNGGIPIHYVKDPHGCLATDVGKELTLTTTVGKFFGYAIVSTSST